MSGGRMPNCPASVSTGFSSTPVKTDQGKDFNAPECSDDGVLTDDEDTFSLLSPIYHDSFDSDEDLEPGPAQLASPGRSEHCGPSGSPARCELPRSPSVQPTRGPFLSAWEMWLVNKAKEDRFKLEKLADEQQLRKEKKEQQEKEQEQKKKVMEEKIHEWLQMKMKQEKQEHLIKLSKEEEEIQRQLEKRRETERKAQQKYKVWLQKKNQEKIELEKKDKEAAALKEEQERERHERAQEKFKDWLAKANKKSGASPKSPCYPPSPYDTSRTSPSFYNPIPWKPIHVPPQEITPNKTSVKKLPKQHKCQQSPSTALRLRNCASAAQRR
ncbi:coiled-coil domain-containing protein 34 [Spinachia spinachia]